MQVQIGNVNRFVTECCPVAIIDVKDCAMQISVVNAQEQEKENVPVDKLLFCYPAQKMFQPVVALVTSHWFVADINVLSSVIQGPVGFVDG